VRGRSGWTDISPAKVLNLKMSISDQERESLLAAIESMTARELDALPYGAIQLSAEGRVIQFNEYESKLSNLKPSQVLGKDFFNEVAPCTQVQEFYGRFRQGVEAGRLDEDFKFHFAFRQNPREVFITMCYSRHSKTVWVFVNLMKG
jgi:photoactive yellow protein